MRGTNPFEAIAARVLAIQCERGYALSTSWLEPENREMVGRLQREIEACRSWEDVRRVEGEVERLRSANAINRITYLSLLILARLHPHIEEWDGAQRLIEELRKETLRDSDRGKRDKRLSAVSSYEGIIAYQKRDYLAALEHFTNAMERHLTGRGVGNILCALVKADQIEVAVGLYEEYLKRARADEGMRLIWRELRAVIEQDNDLRLFRERASE